MGKLYTALGLMSGTSGDGVDVSIISSDGINQYREISNKYFKYDQKIYENLHNLRDKILKSNEDLKYNNQVVGKVLTSNPNFGLIKMLNFDDFKNRNLNIENKKEVKIIYPIWLF